MFQGGGPGFVTFVGRMDLVAHQRLRHPACFVQKPCADVNPDDRRIGRGERLEKLVRLVVAVARIRMARFFRAPARENRMQEDLRLRLLFTDDCDDPFDRIRHGSGVCLL